MFINRIPSTTKSTAGIVISNWLLTKKTVHPYISYLADGFPPPAAGPTGPVRFPLVANLDACQEFPCASVAEWGEDDQRTTQWTAGNWAKSDGGCEDMRMDSDDEGVVIDVWVVVSICYPCCLYCLPRNV